MSHKAKCPKCGEIEQVEITKTWGFQVAELLKQANDEFYSKTEIYCNTCGQVSIIDGDTSSHTDEAK